MAFPPVTQAFAVFEPFFSALLVYSVHGGYYASAAMIDRLKRTDDLIIDR